MGIHLIRAGRAAAAAVAAPVLAMGVAVPAFATPSAQAAPALTTQVVRPTTDFDGDGFADLAAGVPQVPVGTVTGAGSVSVVFGSATGPDRNQITTINQNTAGVTGAPETNDAFGAAVAGGDLDGDGFDDLAVGTPGEDDTSGTTDTGSVTILLGGAAGFTPVSTLLNIPTDVRSNGDRFGDSIAVGDFNGNGVNDLAVLATGDDSIWDYYDATETAALAGTGTGTGTGGVVTDDAGNPLLRPGPGHRLDTARQGTGGITPQAVTPTIMRGAAGDITGDGFADLVVTRLDGSTGLASVFLVPGSSSGLRFDLLTSMAGGGRSVAVGDVDGDGFDDAVVGQPFDSESGTGVSGGAVTAYYGSASGLSATDRTFIYQDSAGVPGSAEVGDALGSSVAVGDVTGDGFDDVLAGLPGEDITDTTGVNQTDAGSALLFLGGAGGLTGTGSVNLNQDGTNVPGTIEAGDRHGSASALADYTGDGRADYAIGADGEDAGTGSITYLPGTSTGVPATGGFGMSDGTLGYPAGAFHIGDVIAA